MTYLLGIDSGGTSTKAAVYDTGGKLIKQVETGGSNFLVNLEQATYNVVKAVKLLLDYLKTNKYELIVLGGAGIDSGDASETIKKELEHYSKNVIVMNDAWMAHMALLKGKDGILTISGTGSISIGMSDGERSRVGGWGHLLGDQGSAYDIAINYMKSILAKTDIDSELTEFDQNFLDHLKLRNVFEMVKFVHISNKSEIARLAEFVSENALKGDESAVKVLNDAGKSLAGSICSLMTKQFNDSSVNVALTGSVLQKNNIVFNALKEELHRLKCECNVTREAVNHTISVYYLYLSLKESNK